VSHPLVQNFVAAVVRDSTNPLETVEARAILDSSAAMREHLLVDVLAESDKAGQPQTLLGFFGLQKNRDPAVQEALLELATALHAAREDGLVGAATNGFGEQQAIPWMVVFESRLKSLEPEAAAAWRGLADLAEKAASRSRPSNKWLRQAEAFVVAIGRKAYAAELDRWAEGMTFGRYGLERRAEDILRGIVWASIHVADTSVAHRVGLLAERCFTKIPDHGPASKRLGNACLLTLGAMPDTVGVAALSRAGGKIRYASAQSEAFRALDYLADRNGLTRDAVAELGVPDGGLGADNRYVEPVGDFRAVVRLMGNKAVLHWIKPSGKLQKSIPKALKTPENEAVLAALEQRRKALKELYEGQVQRLEALWLRGHTLTLERLRTLYLTHPVVGHASRRLVWLVGEVPVIWRRDALRGLGDAQVPLEDEATVRLWHPTDAAVEELLVWRDWLASEQLEQPFPQVWREVFRPEAPDATQDQRFRGCVVRQSVVRNLLQQRSWIYMLQGYWDSHNAPARQLDVFKLTAEFDADPLRHRIDASYIYNYLALDGVRFYPHGQEPTRLGDVPPMVFSEVLRDVDLFVSVAGLSPKNTPDLAGFANHTPAARIAQLYPVSDARKGVLAVAIHNTSLRGHAAVLDDALEVLGADGVSYRIHIGSAAVSTVSGDAVKVKVRAKVKKAATQAIPPYQGDCLTATVLARALALRSGS